jgi:hypothetical protein
LALWGVLAALVFSSSHAEDSVAVRDTVLGSGAPGDSGSTAATPVMDGMYHAPQYMPGSPTAATIYPRVIDVKCTQVGGMLNCDGYNWSPDMGRAEYLMIRPTIVKPVQPKVITIIKEVPVKQGKE